MNEKRESFKDLVRTCMKEMKEERTKKQQLREALKKYVKSVLKEVIAGPQAPEQDAAEKEKINKGFAKDGNQPADQTQDQQVQQLSKLVHGINSDFQVYRDTTPAGPAGYTSGKRNFIIIDAGELFSVYINERWENNFDVTAMIKQADRVKAIGLSWEQVKAFVKANFADVAKSYVQKAKDKVDQNREDEVPARDSELPDTTKGIQPKPISDEPQEDDDAKADDMVDKEEDEPSAPMKQVTKPGKDPKSMNKAKDQKTTPQTKPPKHTNDKELVKKMAGKKRDKNEK